MWIRAGRKESGIYEANRKKRIKAREQGKGTGTGRGLFRPGSGTVPLSIKVCLTQWMT